MKTQMNIPVIMSRTEVYCWHREHADIPDELRFKMMKGMFYYFLKATTLELQSMD